MKLIDACVRFMHHVKCHYVESEYSETGGLVKVERSRSSAFAKFCRIIFGSPLDLKDTKIFHRLALVPFLAWVGLGADGLSSSSYGPPCCLPRLLQFYPTDMRSPRRIVLNDLRSLSELVGAPSIRHRRLFGAGHFLFL